MNRKALLFLNLVILCSRVHATYHSGFAVGVQGGIAHLNGKQKYSDSRDPEAFLDGNLTKTSGIGGLHSNYTWVTKNQYVYGIEVYGSYLSLKKRSQVTQDEPIFTCRVQQEYALGLVFKFGKVIQEKWLPYVLIGPEVGRFVYDFHYSEGGDSEWSNRCKKHFWGLKYGLGCTYEINDHFHLSLEFSHTLYGRKSLLAFQSDGIGSESTGRNQIRPFLLSACIKVAYCF